MIRDDFSVGRLSRPDTNVPVPTAHRLVTELVAGGGLQRRDDGRKVVGQHGFLTLALSTGLLDQVFAVTDVGVVLNYGLNRVRFPAPLRTGKRVRMHVAAHEATKLEGGIQVVYGLRYEVEGQDKPCAVAELVFRYYDSVLTPNSRSAEGSCGTLQQAPNLSVATTRHRWISRPVFCVRI